MTPATRLLDRLSIEYRTHSYDADPSHPSYGEEAAERMGVDPSRILKTLLAAAESGGLMVGVLTVAAQLDLKALAAAAGAKKVRMAEPDAAERATGYVVGGISPIGQKRRLRRFIDSGAEGFETVFVSGGRRGLEIELSPGDLARAAEARFAPIARG